MKHSESLANIAAALSKAQGAMPAAPKDAKNDHLRNKYATLGSVIATIQPVLAAHGLSYIQMPSEAEPGFMALTTRIMHESGEWIEDTMRAAVPQSKLSEIQAAGSVISYMRRYSLSAAFGIMTDDDDGQAASTPPRQAQQPRQTAPRPSAPPAPAPAGSEPLGKEAGARLHAQLGAMLKGTELETLTHADFAAQIIGREVTGLGELTRAEGKIVYNVAKEKSEAA